MIIGIPLFFEFLFLSNGKSLVPDWLVICQFEYSFDSKDVPKVVEEENSDTGFQSSDQGKKMQGVKMFFRNTCCSVSGFCELKQYHPSYTIKGVP